VNESPNESHQGRAEGWPAGASGDALGGAVDGGGGRWRIRWRSLHMKRYAAPTPNESAPTTANGGPHRHSHPGGEESPMFCRAPSISPTYPIETAPRNALTEMMDRRAVEVTTTLKHPSEETFDSRGAWRQPALRGCMISGRRRGRRIDDSSHQGQLATICGENVNGVSDPSSDTNAYPDGKKN
jgi:hypothetical protein